MTVLCVHAHVVHVHSFTVYECMYSVVCTKLALEWDF